MLARAYIKGEKESFSSIFNENINVCLGILTCAFAFIVGGADPLCDFFFNRGKVSPTELQTIVSLTRLFSIAFIGVLFYIMFGMAMLASDHRKQYAILGVSTQLMVFFLNVLGTYFYNSIFAFPIAFGIGHIVSAIIMMTYFSDIVNIAFIKQKGIALIGAFIPAMIIFVTNSAISINSVFLLILDTCILVVCLPFTAIMLGFNPKQIFLKLKTKYL